MIVNEEAIEKCRKILDDLPIDFHKKYLIDSDGRFYYENGGEISSMSVLYTHEKMRMALIKIRSYLQD